MFFEVVLEITLILIFSSFSRNQNQQFSLILKYLKYQNLQLLTKAKYPLNTSVQCAFVPGYFDNFSALGKECGV